MIRRLRVLASSVSLALSLAILVLWLSNRGNRYLSIWAHGPAAGARIETLVRNDWFIVRIVEPVSTPFPPRDQHFVPAWLAHLGIRAGEGSGDYVLAASIENGPVTYAYQRMRSISVHFGLILLLTAVAPSLWLLRRPSRHKGVCRRCRYDLRATPDRCPECGTPVSEKHKVTA